MQFPDVVQLIALADSIVPTFKQQERDKQEYVLPEIPEQWRMRWLSSVAVRAWEISAGSRPINRPSMRKS